MKFSGAEISHVDTRQQAPGLAPSPEPIPDPIPDPIKRDPLAEMREAQRRWAAVPLKMRLRLLRRVRQAIAREALPLAATVANDLPGYLHRNLADTLVAEVLPLLAACKFLEREASRILAPQQLGTGSRPLWMGGVSTVVHRVPLGVVLILAPANYPLFLPGVQALQALAAGNAVLWKPARGGAEAAHVLKRILNDAGLDPCLVKILDETPEAGSDALALGADKVFLTGSVTTGRSVMHALAETLTPSVMELSGCDAVFILDGADVDRAVDAIVFGLRFNGSATCMAPRRIFATATVTKHLLPRLLDKLSGVGPIAVPPSTARRLDELLEDAIEKGATVVLDGRDLDGRDLDSRDSTYSLRPAVLDHARAGMLATRADIFAPLLSILRVADEEEALAEDAKCPYALTASIFGPPPKAEALAARVRAGNVIINDIIVPTADPRAPFGGRGQSGFGVTRGREGLLEMTAVKTVQLNSGRSSRAYQPTTPAHAELFLGIIGACYGKGLRQRWKGMRELFHAARKIK